MKLDFARGTHRVALVCVVVAWAVAAHYTTALVETSAWGALLGIAPFAFVAATFAWHSPWRTVLLALLAFAALGLALLWPTLARNVGWMYFIQHVGTNALLGIAFGRTLTGGREPMCTRVAALIHGAPGPVLARYTRGVTIAWTLFFGLMATASIALFAFGPLDLWSAFANLLTFPLVALMFAGEYAVRLRVLPPEARSGILDAVRAYWQPPPSAALAGSTEKPPARAAHR
ncbi:hypothetical protein PA01_01820 [Azoarcus sp. PA01]|nr:hypothetical protein PA01_01820 [Azoarcus sp. PA01]